MWRPLRRAIVFLRQRAREWTVTGFLMINPSFTSFRICWPEVQNNTVVEDAAYRTQTKYDCDGTVQQKQPTHESLRWRSHWFRWDPATPSSCHSARRWTPSASEAWACWMKKIYNVRFLRVGALRSYIKKCIRKQINQPTTNYLKITPTTFSVWIGVKLGSVDMEGRKVQFVFKFKKTQHKIRELIWTKNNIYWTLYQQKWQ